MIDRELLLKPRLAEEDYDIPGVGTVRLRLLSWKEGIELQAKTKGGADADEVYPQILAAALVDPPITPADAAQWIAGAPGDEIENLVVHILTRSGIRKGAQKSA